MGGNPGGGGMGGNPGGGGIGGSPGGGVISLFISKYLNLFAHLFDFYSLQLEG
jgi:hypothetical protein